MGIVEGAAILAVVIAAASAAAQAAAAKQQARVIVQAAEDDNVLIQNEFTRQQVEVERVSEEAKSDVVRRADAQLGTLFASVGELGSSTSTIQRLVAEIGGFEGLDLSRIESNNRADVEALQARKVAASQGSTNVIAGATRAAANAQIGAGIQFAGGALQIGVSFAGKKAQLKRSQANAKLTRDLARRRVS